LTPGVDLDSLRPDTYGKRITASALPALLSAIDRLQSTGILAGLLNLQQIVLGGHSAGGRVAIESANPKFVPQIAAAFAYGAHTAAVVQLGFPPATILPLPDALPLLLIGGTCDGVIAQSGQLYGVSWEQPTTPILRTFREAIAGGSDAYLLLIEGANHYCISHPLDETTRRSIDFPATQPEAQQREVLAEAIGRFIDAQVRQQSDTLELLAAHNPLIARFERK
ncbi:MAG: dienelactone hydrolase, partial [Microcoleus sp. SIO2G3]|nr:dienelactone hydrolase [Microcoleus sp. SIO2G3]